MKKEMKSIFHTAMVLLLAGALLQSCTKVDEPYYTVKAVTVDTNLRTVLLEDYTGHTCVNCAPAAKSANALQESYEGQVFVIGVHAGNFAKPDPNHYNPYLLADYRCATGNDWYGYSGFNIDQNPKGMVNRTAYKGKISFVPSEWNGAILAAQELPKVAVMSMNNNFDSQNQTLTTRVDTKFLTDLDVTVNLTVCIIEDSIYGGQLNSVPGDSIPIIKNFRFMHLLRGSMNGSWGEELSVSPGSGDLITKTLGFDFNGKTWVPGHCSTVAFISDAETREILHVIKAPVVK
jgi:hypothetical protein